jgi:hypothetical protein
MLAQLFLLVPMSFLFDIFSNRAINLFLGNEEHVQPNQCQYLSSPDADQTTVNFKDLPIKQPGTLRLIIVSDTHERHTKLGNIPIGDIFIHCGDILMTSGYSSNKSGLKKLYWFNEWIQSIPCTHKLVIAGNHDTVLEKIGKEAVQSILTNAIYLENCMIEIDQLMIWGTPSSSGKSGNTAFQSQTFTKKTLEEAPLAAVDILLSHGYIYIYTYIHIHTDTYWE